MSLEVENLYFSYGKEVILENINFSIPKNSFLSIIGPNGSGKTSLLKCLNNFSPIQKGKITLFGKDISKYSLREKAKYIAYVPQQSSVNFQISGIEMILQGRTPYINSKLKEEDLKIAYYLIERFQLEKLAFRNINELSGGERQMILIARALAQKPSFLILDEPTAALDIKNQIFVLGELEKMVKEEELSIIMTIHDLNLVSMFSTDVIAISEKKVHSFGKPKEVLNSEIIKKIYGIHTKIFNFSEYPVIQIEKEKNILNI